MTALDELEKRIEEELKKETAMENRKTSIIVYPADFLASVHNFKKSEIANLIVAICEFNLFGATSVKLSELNKKRFDAINK
ncbi:MAG: hypothetical protein IJ738_02055 [Alphaproteobacteria bacterium]|nr:hypothetical protein [Alphaproteobacteria bacterium]